MKVDKNTLGDKDLRRVKGGDVLGASNCGTRPVIHG